MASQDTLCGWGDRRKIAYFVENAEVIIPRRSDQLVLSELLPWPREAAVTLLDLGGWLWRADGADSSSLYACAITCVDGSVEMLALARERLAPYGAMSAVLLELSGRQIVI